MRKDYARFVELSNQGARELGFADTGALWRSLLVPGWGQAATGRHVTGAIFVVWEGTTAMMALKAQQEANYLSANGSGSLRGKRQEVQDWVVLWVFNHLFSGAEAFTWSSSQPCETKLRTRSAVS